METLEQKFIDSREVAEMVGKAFIDFYSSKGWMIGKNRMKDWKAAVRTWERKRKEQSQSESSVYDEWRDA